jgi:ketosteroid isomerase-like protein
LKYSISGRNRAAGISGDGERQGCLSGTADSRKPGPAGVLKKCRAPLTQIAIAVLVRMMVSLSWASSLKATSLFFWRCKGLAREFRAGAHVANYFDCNVASARRIMHRCLSNTEFRRNQMSAEDEIREASRRFYDALKHMAEGQQGTMSAIWARSETATAMHPIGGREVGWDAVAASFDQVAQAASGGDVRIDDQLVRVAGDLAYEIGVERGNMAVAGQTVTINQRVTNIYQRQRDGWKLVHHHADISPEMVEIVKQL